MTLTLANHHSLRRKSGFTLIELMLVLVILGVLAGIVGPRIVGQGERARIQATKTQISNFGTALSAFEVDNGYFPKGKNGLQDLLTAPRNTTTWKGPYMEKIPTDPWDHPYVYDCPGKHNPNSFDLMSTGPDGKVGGDDDITNWDIKK